MVLIRILMLAQSYAPVIGGEERMVQDLSHELVLRGHHVAVATLGSPGIEPQAGGPVRVHRLRSTLYRIPSLFRDSERRHAPPGPDPETTIDLRAVVRDERPDVVHAHNRLVHSYLPLNRPSGPALALSLHDYGLICATKRMMHRGGVCSGPGPLKCVRCAHDEFGIRTGPPIAVGTLTFGPRLRRAVDVFLPVSHAVEAMCGLGPADRSRVIPNFVRPSSPPRPLDDARLDALPREPFILFFGDASVDKGAWHLAQTYLALDRPPPIVFLGRSYIDELEAHPGATVVGPWPRELVMATLERCLFSVAPSLWVEPFGLVALETAAMGRPVVASDAGGLRDIVVDGETGLLVAPGDRSALRAALERLIRDPELRARMGAAARRRAASFGPETALPAYEDAYDLALTARAARARSRV